MGRLNIINMLILSQEIYRVHEIPTKIPVIFFAEIEFLEF